MLRKNRPERHPGTEPAAQALTPRTGAPVSGSAASLQHVAAGPGDGELSGKRGPWFRGACATGCGGVGGRRRSADGLPGAAVLSKRPALRARVRVHTGGTGEHAQLHMCRVPQRPSCNLSSKPRLSSTDSGHAPEQRLQA